MNHFEIHSSLTKNILPDGKCFITGVGGYLASNLARTLAELDIKVVGLYRSKTNSIIDHPNIELIKGDLLKPETYEEALKTCKYIFHVAAHASNWAKDSSVFYKVNIGGTLQLLELAKKYGISKTVVTSSAGTIGPSYKDEVINENSFRKIGFFGDYEESKFICDENILRLTLEGQNIVIVNPTRLYGPGVMGQSNTITHIINKARRGKWKFKLGKGNEIANYAYVYDVVAGHINAMVYGKSGQKYLLGGENCSFNDFMQNIENVSGTKQKLISVPFKFIRLFGKIEDFLAYHFNKHPKMGYKWAIKLEQNWITDCSKANKEIQYKITPVNQGIKNTITWLDKNEL